MTTSEKLKQKFWSVIYPIFPKLEHSVVFLHDKRRQEYHIGWLSPHHSVADLKRHLSSKWGFGNHFVAWEDSDQILSWRKLVNFKHQYHLRLYSDGEIRGHFELTPEANPIKHFFEEHEASRNRDFMTFLGTFVTRKKHLSKLEPDNTVNVDSEITFAK